MKDIRQTGKSHSLARDDHGASILLEYIFSIVITSILFAVLLLVMNSLLYTTDMVITEPQLSIIANDIANQVSSFSNEVSFNRYAGSSWNGDMSGYNTTLLLPDLVQDKQYAVNITYDEATDVGFVMVWLVSSPNINETTSFSSAIKVTGKTFYNNIDRGTIAYYVASQSIEVTVP